MDSKQEMKISLDGENKFHVVKGNRGGLGVLIMSDGNTKFYDNLTKGFDVFENEAREVQTKYELDYDVAKEIVRLSYQTPYSVEQLVHVHKVYEQTTLAVKKIIAGLEEHAKELAESFGSFEELKEQFNGVNNTKRIVELEQRRKRCKNFLELKQIDRELNRLKWGRRTK